MDFYIERMPRPDLGHDIISFHGSYTDRELAELQLDPLDMAVLKQNKIGDTAADILLSLEIIFRRHEERRQR